MSTRETMVRYGRLEGTRTPKNTLVTLRQGDTVYFGISRCNNKAGDTFKKTMGTQIAESRARLAASEDRTNRLHVTDNGDVNLHESGLRGSVDVANIRALLNYFSEVDVWRRGALGQLSDVRVA